MALPLLSQAMVTVNVPVATRVSACSTSSKNCNCWNSYKNIPKQQTGLTHQSLQQLAYEGWDHGGKEAL